jgi:hypothetical protein
MGIFKGLRDSFKAMTGAMDQASGAEPGQPQPPMAILNPTPQEEVDRLIAAGGVTRGVLVRASHAPTDGERVRSMRVDVRVRSRLAGGQQSQEVKLKIRTSTDVAAVLDPGLEIPILMDRTTGLATEVVVDQLLAELAPRLADPAIRPSGWTFDP